MKKYILLIIIVTLVCTLFISQSLIAYGQDNNEDTSVGHDLGDYKAEFGYKYIIYSSGSLERTFEVIIDNEYLLSNEYFLALNENNTEIIDAIHPPLDEIEQEFKSMGYLTTISDGKMTASSYFESFTDYYIAMGYDGFTVFEDDPDTSSYISSSDILYSYITTEQKTVFGNLTRNYDENKLTGKVLSELEKYGIGLDDINFKYTYGTVHTYRRLDTNADNKFFDRDSKLYFHEFNFDIDNVGQKTELTRRIPNADIWYVGAILAGLAIIPLPLLIALIKRKRTS